MVVRIFATMCLVSIQLLGMAAVSRPNLSGEWRLNVSKSTLGEFPVLNSYRYSIEHQGRNIKIVTTGETPLGTTTLTVTCVIGRGQCGVTGAFGNTVTQSRWEGNTLVLDFSVEIQGMRSKRTERMSLSSDGATLTIESKMEGVLGETQFTMVLDRESW